jgi:hypothetical protein
MYHQNLFEIKNKKNIYIRQRINIRVNSFY